jgi:hypothetical protein
VSAPANLVNELRAQVLRLEDDLRARVETQADVLRTWQNEHRRAAAAERTASSWQEWRDDRVTQAAVAWVLTTVFIRFCEDNALLKPVWISGPPERRQEAQDAQLAYFRLHPADTDREWLGEAINHLSGTPATRSLVDSHSALWAVSPSGNAVTALLDFWRERGNDGTLMRDFADPGLSSRFLGDLYQDLSEHAKSAYALLQTPEFVEQFILDQAMEPALAERPLEGFRLIDPACGSGHFLLGAFRRLLGRWDRVAPAMDVRERVQLCLDAISGVDVNPFAVAITRFRLTLAALQAIGETSLEKAPAFTLHVQAGDSLLFGHHQQELSFGNTVALAGFAYSSEDREALNRMLTPGQYDVVVGNPPYITVRDSKLSQAYRRLYSTCHRQYALTVPFMELFFGLAKQKRGDQPSGWTGQITSNSFMKREFGIKLIEKFLVNKDLVAVIDSEGAWIPGHNMDGTPTVIIIARQQTPATATVRAVLSKGVRETRASGSSGAGPYWQAIIHHLSDPGYDDPFISVRDLPRGVLAAHPWSLSGGGAEGLGALLEKCPDRLADNISEIGRTTHTGNDEAFFMPAGARGRLGVVNRTIPVVLGEEVRDFELTPNNVTIFPYDASGEPIGLDELTFRFLWRTRRSLETQLDFGETKGERGLRWFDHSMFFPKRFSRPLSIAFAFVATHNHFVLDRGGKVFKQSAPVIKLPGEASEDDHLALLGVLNSSTACFWLKRMSQPKGGAAEITWSRTYEFTGTTIQDFPLPARLPLSRGRLLDHLAQELSSHSPTAICDAGSPTLAALRAAEGASESILGQMVAQQEELDWETYRLYGIVDDDLTGSGADVPQLALGERAFEIALARNAVPGEDETAWFARHGSTPITQIPARWPAAYRELVQRRLDLMASDRFVGLLEKPEYKRRWASESWGKQQDTALRQWLLERLEDRSFWFDRQGRPAPVSIGQLADQVARNVELTAVIALWEGRPDVPIVQSLTRLVADESVPYLAAHRLKDSGLRKHEAWEETWALQRSQDAGEKVDLIPVPPKYSAADFRRSSYWQARGKLDVPKERFIHYPDAGRATDPTPLLGWAGWDHAQQALALATIIGAREVEGARTAELVPLVAGLAELQPWVEQWHAAVDPTYGVSMAVFCREELNGRARQVNHSLDQLRQWRPTAPTRGRKARS